MKEFIIKQLPINNKNIYRDFEDNNSFDYYDYVAVFGDVFNNKSYNNINICEELFSIFNTHHPDTFRGHSLSVSDIIVLSDVKKVDINNDIYERIGLPKYFYCNGAGFKDITKEVEESRTKNKNIFVSY